MKLKPLKLGNLTIPIPIIQGAMAVRISTATLAAAVASQGGIGLIAGTGMSLPELRKEIRRAREMTSGVIGVNVLFAVQEFAELVRTAVDEAVDLVVSGAGFSRDMFAWGREKDIPIVPIVSTAKLAVIAQRLGAAGVIVEGKEAGGHLGTDRPTREILPEVLAAVSIPVIGAGGIIDGHDIKEVLGMGAAGVQMGTRFAASEESNASDECKRMYVQAASSDVVLVDSPVGRPGQGLRSPLAENLRNGGSIDIEACHACLKRCSMRFCIMKALVNACRGGDVNQALVFAGEQVGRIKEILPTKTIFENLLQVFDTANASESTCVAVEQR